MSPSAFTKVARERMDATLPRMMEGGRRHRETESPRPHTLGGADEYAESTGGGNNFSRVDLRMRF